MSVAFFHQLKMFRTLLALPVQASVLNALRCSFPLHSHSTSVRRLHKDLLHVSAALSAWLDTRQVAQCHVFLHCLHEGTSSFRRPYLLP